MFKNSDQHTTSHETIRLNGKLKDITTIKDQQGNIIHKVMSPLMIEIYPRDIFQIITGATILAIPIGFTQEVWILADKLPWLNILGLIVLSLFFMGSFIHHNFYQEHLERHHTAFIKRIIIIYLFSFLIVAVMLHLIGQTPWSTDWILALKKVLIVTFPASLSAAVTDMIK